MVISIQCSLIVGNTEIIVFNWAIILGHDICHSFCHSMNVLCINPLPDKYTKILISVARFNGFCHSPVDIHASAHAGVSGSEGGSESG